VLIIDWIQGVIRLLLESLLAVMQILSLIPFEIPPASDSPPRRFSTPVGEVSPIFAIEYTYPFSRPWRFALGRHLAPHPPP